LLVALQSTGVLVFMIFGLPLYRQLRQGSDILDVDEVRLWAGVAAIGIVQCGYWISRRFSHVPPVGYNPLLGHLIMFVGRLSFVFGSAMFSLAFFIRAPEVGFPFWRLALLLAVTFSLFCYSLETDRLGRAWAAQR
jgi:hypothetical protein